MHVVKHYQALFFCLFSLLFIFIYLQRFACWNMFNCVFQILLHVEVYVKLAVNVSNIVYDVECMFACTTFVFMNILCIATCICMYKMFQTWQYRSKYVYLFVLLFLFTLFSFLHVLSCLKVRVACVFLCFQLYTRMLHV